MGKFITEIKARISGIFVKNSHLLEKFLAFSVNVLLNGILIGLPVAYFTDYRFSLILVIACGVARWTFFDFLKDFRLVKTVIK
jgi:hypothetical protein